MNEDLHHLVGKKVKIRGRVRVVELIYADIRGGLRVSEPVEGFVSWNIKDCRILPAATKTTTSENKARKDNARK